MNSSPSRMFNQTASNIIHEGYMDSTDDLIKDVDQLPYLVACLFATVLEDSLTTMRILAECNNSLRVTKAMADMDELLALKFSVPTAPTVDPLAKIDLKGLERAEYKLDKLESDRKFLVEVFTSTYFDLALDRCFDALNSHSGQMVERERHYLTLLDDEARNRATRRDLNRQIRQQRVHVKTVTYDTDAIIEKLRSQVEDAALNAEIQSRYIDNWQRSRTEQHQQNIADQEQPPANAIETYKQRLDYEQRVHTEFELLNNIIINETLEKVESWMTKYDKDMEGIDLKIQIMRTDYETTLERRSMLEKTVIVVWSTYYTEIRRILYGPLVKFGRTLAEFDYVPLHCQLFFNETEVCMHYCVLLEKHATLIAEWVAFKEERERIRLYRERMTNAAIVVQAWWRGLLVRKQLGPYKEKPKKKQAKK